MKTMYIFVLLLLIILVGCVKPAQSPTENNQVKKTCTALNGFACNPNEECRGSLIKSSDSNNCCNIRCNAKSTTGNIEVPKFDFGKTDSEDTLGELK